MGTAAEAGAGTGNLNQSSFGGYKKQAGALLFIQGALPLSNLVIGSSGEVKGKINRKVLRPTSGLRMTTWGNRAIW